MNKYISDGELSYALGMSLTIEALKHKTKYLKEVVLSKKAVKNEQLSFLLDLCKKNNINYYYDDRLIERLSAKENCYCIGIFYKFFEKINLDDHLLLYGFNNYGDLGTVLRCAICFDFKDIVLINSKVDYFDPKCIRSSMGAIFQCNIMEMESFADYFRIYRDRKIYSFVSHSKNKIDDLLYQKPSSIIIPQDYVSLDGLFLNDSYSFDNQNIDSELSLPIRSSIILENIYHLKRNR